MMIRKLFKEWSVYARTEFFSARGLRVLGVLGLILLPSILSLGMFNLVESIPALEYSIVFRYVLILTMLFAGFIKQIGMTYMDFCSASSALRAGHQRFLDDNQTFIFLSARTFLWRSWYLALYAIAQLCITTIALMPLAALAVLFQHLNMSIMSIMLLSMVLLLFVLILTYRLYLAQAVVSDIAVENLSYTTLSKLTTYARSSLGISGFLKVMVTSSVITVACLVVMLMGILCNALVFSIQPDAALYVRVILNYAVMTYGMMLTYSWIAYVYATQVLAQDA